jgi:pilus assembly protein CpaF
VGVHGNAIFDAAHYLFGVVRDALHIRGKDGTSASPQSASPVVLIEDTAEIQLEKANLVRFEARREQPGLPAVTIRDLVRATLRHRPDRIILGEVRGGEAFDLLQALNTGHSGTISTIHGNSAYQAITRLTSCVLQAGVELPYAAIRANIADALQLLLHIERRHGKRYASELIRIEHYDPAQDRYELSSVYQRG